jgi:hypothetical protein
MSEFKGVDSYQRDNKFLVKYKQLKRHKYSATKTISENLLDENRLLKAALLETMEYIRSK